MGGGSGGGGGGGESAKDVEAYRAQLAQWEQMAAMAAQMAAVPRARPAPISFEDGGARYARAIGVCISRMGRQSTCANPVCVT